MALDDMLENAADEQIASADLGKISEIAQTQIDAQSQLKHLQEEAKKMSAIIHNIATIKLPEAMAEVGMTSFALESGAQVSIRDEFGCSMVADRKQEAMQFLVDEDEADLIKCVVTLTFSGDEHDKAMELAERLEDEGFDAAVQQSVHASSLKAWFKRNDDYHDLMPQSLFHTFIGQKAVIK